jgi:DNA repair photolyase
MLPLPGLKPAGRGLARQADQGEDLQRRRRIHVRSLPAASALNRCTTSRMPFSLTLNPYRGCEFACVYCYARYTHSYMGRNDPAAFETEIFAKTGLPQRLQRELRRADLGGESIAMGTVTDPYQPVERRLGITRRLLQAFAHVRGITFSITTKSDLVARDIDLLVAMSRHNRVHVNMTVVTMDTELARGLEPRAPRPDLRLAALAAVGRAGIQAGVFAMPVLPGLTDSVMNLERVAAATAAAGGHYLVAQPLFVRDCSRGTLFAYLRAAHPGLLARYQRSFGRGGTLEPNYRRRLAERIAGIRISHGLAAGPEGDQWQDGGP